MWIKLNSSYGALPTSQSHEKISACVICYVAIDKWKSMCPRKKFTAAFHIIRKREKNWLHKCKILLKVRHHKHLKFYQIIYSTRGGKIAISQHFFLIEQTNAQWHLKDIFHFHFQSPRSTSPFWISCKSWFLQNQKEYFQKDNWFHDVLSGRSALKILDVDLSWNRLRWQQNGNKVAFLMPLNGLHQTLLLKFNVKGLSVGEHL